MTSACPHCSSGKLRVNRTPIYRTPYQDLSTQERIRLASITKNFWTQGLDPNTSYTQQRLAQQRVISELAPFYINEGGSTRSANVNNFYR